MADSTSPTGQFAPPEGSEGVQVWERPWTVDEMRKAANNWSLAGDAGMLQYLQDFSQRIISRTHDMQEQVNGLIHESKLTGIRVQNAFNDFIMLANTQFVENRVYDEDVSSEATDGTANGEKKEEHEKTREEREAELIPKITQAMQLGFNVIDTAFEKLDVKEANSDSEDDEDEEGDSRYKTDMILEPKDPYISRSLPYLIGSKGFLTEDDVGLTDLPSEDEAVSDKGSISESESDLSDEETPTATTPGTRGPGAGHPGGSFDSDSETESETESESELFGQKDSESDVSSVSDSEKVTDKVKSQPKFTDELAAKLGNEEAEKRERKHSGTKKERSSAKSKQTVVDEDDLFGPPPMEDEDSPFGKQGGLFSSSGGLFDDDDNEGGLFDDIIADKPRAQSIKQEKPPPPTENNERQKETHTEVDEGSRPRTKSGRKVPVGGVSIFGGGDDDLFGNTKKSSASEDAVPEETSQPVKSMTTGGTSSRGLFSDDEDDLFAAVQPKKAAPPKKEVAAKPAVDLFADDDEEEGDLFASMSTATKKAPPKEEPKSQKKLPTGAVSIFGPGANPLAAAIKAQRPPSDKESDDDWDQEDDDKRSEASSRSATSAGAARLGLPTTGDRMNRSPSVSSNSLFAEEPEDEPLSVKTKGIAAPAGGKSIRIIKIIKGSIALLVLCVFI